ncbi:hypothetical protein ACET3Z_030902 [Daucus carota]
MASLNKDLVMIVLQFLREENFKEAARSLEKESGFYFNMRYFEEKVLAGEWDEVEKYLSGFTNVDDNRFSVKIYFELRKHKYLEALDRKDKAEALNILENELKVFSRINNDLYREMTLLLSLDNFRENEQLSKYGNMVEARGTMMMELKKIIEANPVFNGKLEFPSLRSLRLRTLVNQRMASLNKDLVMIVLQFLREENFKEAARSLEKESGFYFNMRYFEEKVLAGEWDEVEKYLSGFTNVEDNRFSVKIYYELRKHKYLEALDRENEQLSKYDNMVEARGTMMMELKKIIGANPVFNGKLEFPSLRSARLRTLVNQSFLYKVSSTFAAPSFLESFSLTLIGVATGLHSSMRNFFSKSVVSQLLYTNAGTGILVLGSSGFQMLYKWVRHENNPSGKATAKELPHLWKPSSGLLMANDIAGVDLQKSSPCIALTKNDSYVMSACGGKVSVFNALTYGVMTTFMSTPPVPTFLAFFPPDNNYVAVGMDDSTIHIYNVRGDEVKCILKGHQDPVTGLAFSTKLNILISSGADAHICIWSTDTWEKKNSFPLQLTTSESCSACTGDTRVQLHHDEIQFLVSHGTQLALYDAENVDRVQRWIPQDALSAQITSAAFSCNSMLVYASFCDGSIGIFDAERLSLRCHLNPSVYLSLKGSQIVYSVVVAAHPQDPYQFAVGLTDGSVKVIEPFEPEGKWEVFKPPEEGFANGRSASTSTSHHAAEQVQR